MDAEFILVSIDTKSSMKQQELAEKSKTIFLKGTQNGQFWQKCKGGTLCKTLDFGHFLGPTLLGYKIVNTSPIWA